MKSSVHQSTTDSLQFEIGRLIQMLSKELQGRLAEFGITASQWPVLAAVGVEKCHSPSKIADLLGLDGAAVTRHLDTLEKKELLVRVPSPRDRRALTIELTAKGKQLVPWLREAVQAVEERFTSRLTPEQLGQFREALRMLAGEAVIKETRSEDWERS